MAYSQFPWLFTKKAHLHPSVIAFLLASPWANLPITLILIGLFGVKGLIFILSAMLIALVTDVIYQMLDKSGFVKCNVHNW